MKRENSLFSLLVEDDEHDQRQSQGHLRLMGFDVTVTDCPFAARVLFAQQDWDVILIHLATAQDDSLELCRWIRAESTVPIIMLTGRNESIDEVMALNAGADDYALKPVPEKILRARITHQLKRSQRDVSRGDGSTLSWGPLTMDTNQYQFFIGDTEVTLTKSEFHIMRLLLENSSQVLTRSQFLNALGIVPGVGSDHIVDTHASRLRGKIRRHGGGDVVKSVRGIGLRLAALSDT